MSKSVILTFKQTFDLTDPIAEALAEDGLTIESVGFDSLEALALAEMEDHDFKKRSAASMTVEVVDDEAPLIDGGKYHQPDRCVGGVTNEQRAIWAREGLASYAEEKNYLTEPLETVAGDFFCDLIHLASAFGYNPHRFIKLMAHRAESNFDAEATEEPHEGDEEEPPFLEKPLGEEHEWASL